MYSPSITIGVNFDEKWFHELYVYGSCMSCCVRDVIQMMFRVRHISKKRMFYCLNDINRKPYRYDSYANKDMMKLSSHYNVMKDYIVKCGIDDRDIRDVKEWFLYNFGCCKLEDYMSTVNYRNIFLMMIRDIGYTVYENDIEYEVMEISGDIGDVKYDDIEIVSDSDVKDLIMKKSEIGLEKDEKIMMSKYYFTKIVHEDDDNLIWKLWLKDNKKIYNVYNEKNVSVNKMLMRDIKRGYITHMTFDFKKMELMKKLYEILSVSSCNFTLTYNSDDWKLLCDKVDDNLCDDVQKIFNIRTTSKNRDKRILTIINNMLNDWCYGSVKTSFKRVQVHGKRKKVYEYTIKGCSYWDNIILKDTNTFYS